MPTAKLPHNIMLFWSASQSSTEYLIGSENGPSLTGLIRHKVNRARSTITMVGGVSISKIPTDTVWRSSHALTAVAVGIHESLSHLSEGWISDARTTRRVIFRDCRFAPDA